MHFFVHRAPNEKENLFVFHHSTPHIYLGRCYVECCKHQIQEHLVRPGGLKDDGAASSPPRCDRP